MSKPWRAAYAGLLPDRVLVAMRESAHEARFAGWIGRQTDRQFILAARAPGPGVIGLCSAGRARGGPKTDGEIYLLYVDQDWQNRGVGRSLLRAGIARVCAPAATAGRCLWVLAGNPSRFFYEAAGGVRTRRTDGKAVGHRTAGNRLCLARSRCGLRRGRILP